MPDAPRVGDRVLYGDRVYTVERIDADAAVLVSRITVRPAEVRPIAPRPRAYHVRAHG